LRETWDLVVAGFCVVEELVVGVLERRGGVSRITLCI
jgi:hypothetical protein